jgi:hypothetical protein
MRTRELKADRERLQPWVYAASLILNGTGATRKTAFRRHDKSYVALPKIDESSAANRARCGSGGGPECRLARAPAAAFRLPLDEIHSWFVSRLSPGSSPIARCRALREGMRSQYCGSGVIFAAFLVVRPLRQRPSSIDCMGVSCRVGALATGTGFAGTTQYITSTPGA